MSNHKFNIDLEPMSDNNPESQHTLMSQVKKVKIQDLKYYPGNARRGNIEAVAESLTYHGQFKPIVVQKSTGYVLAGNHTMRAASEILNWKTIGVVYVDVDDDQARRIVLADNRTSDLGDYDYDALYEILTEVPDPIGTGYTQDIIDQINQVVNETVSQINETVESAGAEASEEAAGGEEEEEGEGFDDLSDTLPGLQSLKPDAIFSSQDPWGQPEIIYDMLMPRFDTDTLETWSGPTSSEDDGESYYVYSYGTDSTRGMPWDRTILCFYTSDSRFENWWADPAKYTAKMINAGIAGAITHDFSMFAGYPRVTHLWNAYRSKWLARYMQEAGIPIIPNITFCDEESLVMSVTGLPKGAPVIARQLQTIENEKIDPEARKERQRLLIMMSDLVEPEQILIYGNEPGFEIAREIEDELRADLLFVENRSIRRSRWQKERDNQVYSDPKSRKQSARVTGISQTGVAMRDGL